jgi:hypothetical protein
VALRTCNCLARIWPSQIGGPGPQQGGGLRTALGGPTSTLPSWRVTEHSCGRGAGRRALTPAVGLTWRSMAGRHGDRRATRRPLPRRGGTGQQAVARRATGRSPPQTPRTASVLKSCQPGPAATHRQRSTPAPKSGLRNFCSGSHRAAERMNSEAYRQVVSARPGRDHHRWTRRRQARLIRSCCP